MVEADVFKYHTHDISAWNSGISTDYRDLCWVKAGINGIGYVIPEATNAGSGVSGIRSTGDVETRPRNIALLPCIKY